MKYNWNYAWPFGVALVLILIAIFLYECWRSRPYLRLGSKDFKRWMRKLTGAKRKISSDLPDGVTSHGIVIWNVVIDPDVDLKRSDSQLWDAVRAKSRSKYGIDIDTLQMSTVPVNSMATTIIVCPVSSRLGSNAEYAMKGVPSRRNVILLLFHPSEPHVGANPHSQEVLTDPKFTDLGAVVDVLYSQQYGFYNCPTNDNAVQRLAEFAKNG